MTWCSSSIFWLEYFAMLKHFFIIWYHTSVVSILVLDPNMTSKYLISEFSRKWHGVGVAPSGNILLCWDIILIMWFGYVNFGFGSYYARINSLISCILCFVFFLLMQRMHQKLQEKSRWKHSQPRKEGEENNNFVVPREVGVGQILQWLVTSFFSFEFFVSSCDTPF